MDAPLLHSYLVQSTGARNFIEKLTVEELELGDSMPVLDRMVLLPPKDGTLGDADDLDIVFDMSCAEKKKLQTLFPPRPSSHPPTTATAAAATATPLS